MDGPVWGKLSILEPQIFVRLCLFLVSTNSKNLIHLGILTLLQNKAIRAVGGTKLNESFSPLYYKFKVLKLQDMYKYELAKFMHCVRNKTLPIPLINLFDNVKNDLNLNSKSRTQEKLKVPLFKSSKTQKSVKYQGVTLWNSLSLSFKKLSFFKFSTEYKSNHIQNYKL